MKNSPAARLQNLVLSISTQSEQGLDLSKIAGEKTTLPEMQADAFLPGAAVLIIGQNQQLAARATQAVGEQGAVTVLDKAAEYHDFQTSAAAIAYFLDQQPVSNLKQYEQFQQAIAEQRRTKPLVAADACDLVVLDQVINQLSPERALLAIDETFRVLRRGGKAVFRLYLSDEAPPLALPKLPTGEQMQLAPEETEFMKWLSVAGFHGMQMTWRAELPLQVLGGVELRAFIVEAYKGKQGICIDHGHAVIYKGPFSECYDDDGHRFVRGERTAVCAKTYEVLMREPYVGAFEGIPCYKEIPASLAPLFDCNTPQRRDPKVTKGQISLLEQTAGSCDPADGGSCGC